MLRTVSLTAILSLALILTGCKEDRESLAKKAIAKLNDMTATLATVQDEASSKAAATKINSIVADLQDLKKKEDALPKISADEQKKMEEAHKKELEDMQGKLMKEMVRISMNPKLMTPELKTALDGLSKIGNW